MNVVARQFPHTKRNRARRRRFHRVDKDQPRLELRRPLQLVNRPVREASTFRDRSFNTFERFRRDDETNATGIKFGEYSIQALSKAIRKALIIYEDKTLLAHYRQNGMAKDFSWQQTAVEYETFYQR